MNARQSSKTEIRDSKSRRSGKLSAKYVETRRKPGYYGDGVGLYLQVSASGSKSWIFRYRHRDAITCNGKPTSREMGLGPLAVISLAEARRKALEARGLLLEGKDPIKIREALRLDQARQNAMLFSDCAAAFIKAHRAGWKNAKHAEQWENTLKTYCGPVFGKWPVQDVSTGAVVRVLEAIWAEKPETASRLRARIERVLDWATARGYRSGENPARWRGHLDKLLPRLSKKSRVVHHAALPFAEVPDFIAKLREQEGVAARALEFTVMTAARTGEAIGAQWAEIDLDKALWTVPPARMKAQREHRVPLAAQVVKVLNGLQGKDDTFVFPGLRNGTPISNMAMLELLKRMGREDITVHGFRASLRNWAAECTNYPREVCEMALAHVVRDQTEAAYMRSDLFEKRRRLMDEWARYCDMPVVPIASRGAR